MTTEYLINALDKIGTRFVCQAYKYAYHGAGKPKGFPESFWEKIKIWENFSEKSEGDIEIKSDYDLDAEAATKRIEDAKTGDKKKYLDDAMKLAKKYNEKSNDAKSDTVSINEKLKSVATNSDLKYNEEKKKLAEKYISKNINASCTNGDNTMEISQKDLKKIMKAMNTINKHFAEEVEDDLDEENAENSEEEMTTIELPSEIAEAVKMALESGDSNDDESDEDEDSDYDESDEDEDSDYDETVEEDEESEDDESEDEEEMATIELPVEIAEAVKEAFESCENCEDDEDEEDESEEEYEDDEEDESEEVEENFSRKSKHFSNNMGYCEGCNEKVKVVNGKCANCGEYIDSDNASFSMKSFYRFAETVTETIENLNKKVNKLATEIQEAANEKTIQFSKKDFYRFAETVTETIENIANKVEQLESEVEKNEITKDISNLTDSFNNADDFLTNSDEDEVKKEVIVDDNMEDDDAPIYAGTENVDSVDMPVDEKFSKRYNNIKNFLTL